MAANDAAKKIIREMKNCEEKDEKLLQEGKKASNKLVYAIKMEKELHNVLLLPFRSISVSNSSKMGVSSPFTHGSAARPMESSRPSPSAKRYSI